MKAAIKSRITKRSRLSSRITERSRIVKKKGLAVRTKKSSIGEEAEADG